MPELTYGDELAAIHRPLRREFSLLPDIVAAVDDGDSARASEVGGWVATLATFLHNHHDAEDLLWPMLRERANDDASALQLIERMERDHEGLDADLSAIDEANAAWMVGGAATDRDRLVAAMQATYDTMVQHLDVEEADACDLAAKHVSQEEWDKIGEKGRSHLKGREGLLVLATIMEEMDDDEKAWLTGPMPPPVRWFVVPFAQRSYRRYITSIRAAG